MSQLYCSRRTRGRLVVQDAADRQAEKLIDRAHPFAVARRQVIVDRDDMDAPAGQRVEINRQRGDERFAFAGRHFGDLARDAGHAADKLHVEGDHLPFQRMFADDDFRAAQPPAGVLDHGEGFGQDFVQPPGQLLVVLDLGNLLLPGGGFLAQNVVRPVCSSASRALIFTTRGRNRFTSRSFLEPMNFFTMNPIMIA